MLSIVVPVYNVERYLGECLTSIAEQALADIEVIMVDDGSTDASGSIARGWAGSDPRFVLVSQPNRGLGAARNTGVRHASGRYLAFVDSDDRVSERAFAKMVGSLEATGSDIATGNVKRFDDYRTWQAPIATGIFTEERLETHISEYRELLRDLLAPNKVFRREFWDREGIRFPEGVFYEDLPTIIPAHLKAEKVDVLTTTACLYRARPGDDLSITQSKSLDSKHMHDRLGAVTAVSRLMGTWPDPSLRIDYDAQALDRDVRYFLDLLPTVDEDYRREALPFIRRVVAATSPGAMEKVRAKHRLKYHLLMRGEDDLLLEYIDFVRSGDLDGEPLRRRGRTVHLDPPLLRRARIPKAVSDVTAELRVVTRVEDVEATDQQLRLSGWAYIDGLAAVSPGDQEISVWLGGDGKDVEGRRLHFTVDAAHAPQATRRAGQRHNCYDGSGFEAVLAWDELRQEDRSWGSGNWHVEVEVRRSGVGAAAALRSPAIGPAQRAWTVRLTADREARVSWTGDQSQLRVDLRRRQPAVEEVRLEDGIYQLTLRLAAGAVTGTLALDERGGERHIVPLDHFGDLFGASISTDLITPHGVGSAGTSGSREFRLLVRERERGRWKRVVQHVLERSVLVSPRYELVARRDRFGNSVLLSQAPAPRLTGVEMKGDDAHLRVMVDHPVATADSELVLSARDRFEEWAQPLQRTSSGLECELPLASWPLFGEVRPLPAGTWDLLIRDEADHPIVVGAPSLDSLPQTVTVSGRAYRVTDRAVHAVSLDVEPDLVTDSEFARTAVVRAYPKLRRKPLRADALYQPQRGFSGSPAVLQREISRRSLVDRHRVALGDGQPRPGGEVEVVPLSSSAHCEALARSRLVVGETHFPAYLERRRGQLVVQTWHGIGVRHTGLDSDVGGRAHADRIRAGSRNWDYLVSPSPFCSPILRRALAFDGELLETGLPRNDIFRSPDRDERSHDVRRRLGIDDSARLVLYAPTRREEASDSRGRYRLDLRLDLDALSRDLGGDHVVLFRRHPDVVDSLPRMRRAAVRDVSLWLDANELLLVADVVVTDYSTLMFDFASTGKPMVFFAYDLDAQQVRGFYFDYEGEVPGPLVRDEADLAGAILSAGETESAYRSRYERFRERFCPWDDGHAAERVVGALEAALEHR